jgi:hypothetical protein
VFAGSGIGGAVISFALEAMIEHIGIGCAFRVLGLVIIGTRLPAVYLVKERVPYIKSSFIEW